MPLDFRAMSLQDALDLAIAMEAEAKERYEEFTRLVGGRYPGDAAEMFRVMAGYEAKHGAELSARRQELFGDAPARVGIEQLDDAEAPDRGQPRVFMSARQAMEVALASEHKAHAFFDGALPLSKQVQDLEPPSARYSPSDSGELAKQGILEISLPLHVHTCIQ